MAKSLRVPYGLLTEAEQAVYRRVVALVGDRLKPEDETVLEAFARAVVRYRTLSDLESRFNRLAEETEEAEAAAAAAAAAYKYGVLQVGANKQVMHAASELGLTPAARKRIGTPEDETEADAILEFIRAS